MSLEYQFISPITLHVHKAAQTLPAGSDEIFFLPVVWLFLRQFFCAVCFAGVSEFTGDHCSSPSKTVCVWQMIVEPVSLVTFRS